MQIKKVINGYEYEFEVPDNMIIAKSICKSYLGYKIEQKTEGYHTQLFMIASGQKDKKLIGTLIYNPKTENIILYKHINPQEHIHIKSKSFGINNEIIKNLRTSDKIVIDDGKDKYTISVANALKKGQYLHFTAFELQLFVPIENFKKL